MRVYMLGDFSVSVGAKTVGEGSWRLKKAASLLKLLALTEEHRLHRERLMGLLWPDLAEKSAANNLRYTLHVARKTLEPVPGTAYRYLQLQGEQVALCPEGPLWTDVGAFEDAAAMARRARDPMAFRTALDLYAGDLLPGDLYEGWAEERRRELRRTYLALLSELAGVHEERGELEAAIEALEEAVAVEPTREEAHAGLMRLHALSCRQRLALRQYERLSEALSGELELEPSVEVLELRDDISAGTFPPRRPADPQEPDPSTTIASDRHNLPIYPSSFVGREREMVEVKRALAMIRLLTLTGAGGSGKTRLALAVAAELAGAYPDGAWLVELAPLSKGTLVPKTVAEVLRVNEQAELARFDQEKIDRICEAMVRAALHEARCLGAMAVEETGYGVVADKERKNRSAAEGVWARYRSLRAVGVISESEGVVEIATPRGVIAGITPSTEPTSSAIFKALTSIKSRNALVLSPHHVAARCTNETVRVLREAAAQEGLPPDALGCMTRFTREGTRALMEHEYTAVVMATNYAGLVPAAYSSEKPTFVAGPANVPVLIERTANVDKAAQDIMVGKCFDNDVACASEQSMVVDAPLGRALREQFRARSGYFLSAAEAGRLSRVVVTRDGRLNPAVVGKSAALIALMAGIRVPPGTRCLIAEVGGVGRDFPLSMQKLSPILAFYVEEGTQQATARCLEVLSYGGLGHTAEIHTRSRRAAVAFGEKMPVSRVIVNTSTAHGALGLSTALSPSLILGCGSRGNIITSDEVSPLHLMDIKRIVVETQPIEGVTPTLIDATWELEVAA